MKKKIVAIVLVLSMIFTYSIAFAAETAEKGYTDISGHWAEKAINQLADKETFMDKDGKFNPKKSISRGEFAIMLYKALGIKIKYIKEPDVTELFKDVKNEEPWARAICDLVAAGIIDDKEKFRPNDPLRRDDMVHYLINALEDMTGGNYALIKMMPAEFTDDKDINPAYKNDFIKAQLLKIIVGRGNNMFYPKADTLRAEAAMATSKLLDVLKSLKVIS